MLSLGFEFNITGYIDRIKKTNMKISGMVIDLMSMNAIRIEIEIKKNIFKEYILNPNFIMQLKKIIPYKISEIG